MFFFFKKLKRFIHLTFDWLLNNFKDLFLEEIQYKKEKVKRLKDKLSNFFKIKKFLYKKIIYFSKKKLREIIYIISLRWSKVKSIEYINKLFKQ